MSKNDQKYKARGLAFLALLLSPENPPDSVEEFKKMLVVVGLSFVCVAIVVGIWFLFE